VKRVGAQMRKLQREGNCSEILFSFFVLFFILIYYGFLIETGVNFITQNILRRFSITALECVSSIAIFWAIITKLPPRHFLERLPYNCRKNNVVKSNFCSSNQSKDGLLNFRYRTNRTSIACLQRFQCSS